MLTQSSILAMFSPFLPMITKSFFILCEKKNLLKVNGEEAIKISLTGLKFLRNIVITKEFNKNKYTQGGQGKFP